MSAQYASTLSRYQAKSAKTANTSFAKPVSPNSKIPSHALNAEVKQVISPSTGIFDSKWTSLLLSVMTVARQEWIGKPILTILLGL